MNIHPTIDHMLKHNVIVDQTIPDSAINYFSKFMAGVRNTISLGIMSKPLETIIKPSKDPLEEGQNHPLYSAIALTPYFIFMHQDIVNTFLYKGYEKNPDVVKHATVLSAAYRVMYLKEGMVADKEQLLDVVDEHTDIYWINALASISLNLNTALMIINIFDEIYWQDMNDRGNLLEYNREDVAIKLHNEVTLNSGVLTWLTVHHFINYFVEAFFKGNDEIKTELLKQPNAQVIMIRNPVI